MSDLRANCMSFLVPYAIIDPEPGINMLLLLLLSSSSDDSCCSGIVESPSVAWFKYNRRLVLRCRGHGEVDRWDMSSVASVSESESEMKPSLEESPFAVNWRTSDVINGKQHGGGFSGLTLLCRAEPPRADSVFLTLLTEP